MSSKRYESEKFVLDSALKEKDFTEMVLIWNEKFNSVVVDGMISDIVVGLVLAHPDYRIQHNGLEIKIDDGRFARPIERSTKCEWKDYGGYECPWNEDIFLRGKLEIDHHWPSSLGGPTIDSNRLHLCRHHNSCKSNSIEHYVWENTPSWLLPLLKKIHERKNWGFNSKT